MKLPYTFFCHPLFFLYILPTNNIHTSVISASSIDVAMLCIVLRAGKKVDISGKNIFLDKIQIRVSIYNEVPPLEWKQV